MNCVSCGKLYIVSTPIGNLGDVTARAVEVLDKADLILSEDTRETDKLLKKFDFKKSQIPYTDEKHDSLKDQILNKLKNGEDIALVSDSGTPLISDPGFKLVRYLKSQDIEIVSIPGPCAAISALTVSGLPTDTFIFLGFLPKSEAKRKKILSEYGDHQASIIIYESPKVVKKLLTQIKNTLGNREISLIKDMTKKFEHVKTGSLDDILDTEIKEKGEYIVVVAKEGYRLNE